MSGGGQGIVARVAGMANQPSSTMSNAGASYVPVTASQYVPAFSSQQTNVQSGESPLVAQLRAQRMSPMQQYGLQRMTYGSFQSPYFSGGIQSLMPAYNVPALAYRPNMSGVVANLKNVVPSVELQQRLAAEAAKKEAEENARIQQMQQNYGGD